MSTSLPSLSEEELVEKATRHVKAKWPWFNFPDVVRTAFDAIDLSSILSRLEAAEGERDEASEWIADAEREIDRLRAAVAEVAQTPHELGSDGRLAKARAALSTGDRQDDDSGVRTGVPTQPGIAGTDNEGGETA